MLMTWLTHDKRQKFIFNKESAFMVRKMLVRHATTFGKVRHISRIESWLGVYKEHYTKYYVPKSSILLARTGVWKMCSVACGFSSIKIDYSYYIRKV